MPVRDLAVAWAMATLFSGLPSTLHALWTGGDPLEATRAAAAMLMPIDSASLGAVFAAAAIVHSTISLFWALVFGLLLPPRNAMPWALAGSIAVGCLDLLVVAPVFFPPVAALPFWPQLADHAMWGVLLGATLELRARTRKRDRPR